MNVKTTLVLALVFALLVLGYVATRRPASPSDVAAPEAPAATQAAVTRNLLPDPPANVTKIAVKRKSGDEWSFEKKSEGEAGGAPVWFMIKPTEMKALTYEVDRIAREIGQVQYEIGYKTGEPGAVSASDAGLAPPEATITITDDAGKSATVEIGKTASENETFARVAGGDQIVVAKSNLKGLLKEKPLDYRDQQLWNFAAENATRAEIVDRSTPDSPITYVFARDGGKWMMESPVTARATAKVDEMLRTFCRLRVAKWEDDNREKLAVYGLQPAALDIKVTVEESVPAKKGAKKPEADPEDKDDEDGEEQEPQPMEKKTAVYALRVADRSPIGEDTKAYVRAGDDSAVGTVMKSTTDKFKPVMAEWRDMQLTTADATKASRVELQIGRQSTTLVQKDGQWVFDPDGAPAEQHAVTETLTAIKSLKAVAILDKPEPEATLGFDHPQSDIRITIPGVEAVERVTIGAYTDSAARRLVYVRRNEGPVAKVKADDVAVLLRSPTAYRDRTIFDLQADRIRQLAFSMANPYTGGRSEFALQRSDGQWSMIAPVSAPVQEEQVNKLVSMLSPLKADSVVAERGEASGYGLNDPAALLTISFESQGESAPPPTAFELAATVHDGKYYARRKDQESVYEVTKAFYDALLTEFRTPDIFTFEAADIQKASIRRGDAAAAFVRAGAKWTYEAEPDLPIDSAKLDKVLTEVKAIKATRYASYKLDAPATLGLDKPHYELVLTAKDGKSTTLSVSEKTAEGQPTPMHFAAVDSGKSAFLISSDAVPKIFVSLADVEKK